MRLRIVVDTNVLIAGVVWNGSPARLVQAAADGLFDLVISAALIDELRVKLAHPKFTVPLGKAGRSAAEALAIVTAVAREVTAADARDNALRDPTDLHVLGAAQEAADIIVSRDKDLLSLGTFNGVPIMGVEDCLHTLGLHS